MGPKITFLEIKVIVFELKTSRVIRNFHIEIIQSFHAVAK
jgi:hypothetical protein